MVGVVLNRNADFGFARPVQHRERERRTKRHSRRKDPDVFAPANHAALNPIAVNFSIVPELSRLLLDMM